MSGVRRGDDEPAGADVTDQGACNGHLLWTMAISPIKTVGAVGMVLPAFAVLA